MPIHDDFARITPYELFLPTEEFAEDWFPKIREEAEGRAGGLESPESFVLLGEAALALREIRTEEDPPEMIHQYGALLFHAFHFFESGKPLYLLDTSVVRFLVERGPEAGEWDPSLPGKAGYLQFPHHLVWTSGEGEEAPESLDGIFWASPDGDNLDLLIVMGMRKDRPGLAVVPLPTLPLLAASPWASMEVREEGPDFESSLPGAELEGLFTVASGAEALKLLMRIFWYLDLFPGSVEEREAPEGVGEAESPPDPPIGPTPSTLPYRRVVRGEP